MTAFDALMDDLRNHVRISPSAQDELGDVLDLPFVTVDDGIETMRGDQIIRVTRDEITISHVKFGSVKRIPLR